MTTAQCLLTVSLLMAALSTIQAPPSISLRTLDGTPRTSAGRRPVKLAVADALDGITSDDLVLLESTPTPATGSNDGASMAGCGLQLPDPLGGLHGWVWAEIAGDNGTRDSG